MKLGNLVSATGKFAKIAIYSVAGTVVPAMGILTYIFLVYVLADYLLPADSSAIFLGTIGGFVLGILLGTKRLGS